MFLKFSSYFPVSRQVQEINGNSLSAGIPQIPADVVPRVVLLPFSLGFCQVIQTSMRTNRHVEVRYNLENSILQLVNGDSKTPKLLSVGQS